MLIKENVDKRDLASPSTRGATVNPGTKKQLLNKTCRGLEALVSHVI